MADIDLLLKTAADADYWDFEIRIGEGIDPDESTPQLSARFFNTIVHFIAPTDVQPSWRIAEERLDSTHPEPAVVGDVSAAQVIDVVPGSLERWVLDATHRLAADLLAANEWVSDPEEAARTRERGLQLISELEQAEAHSQRWQERFAGQYGEIIIYELATDEPIVYRRTGPDEHPGLLMGHEDDRDLGIILVAPDSRHPWRRSSPGHVDEYGRRISVRETLEYAGEEHREWVIKQTALALGDTLAALRENQAEALDGRDPVALSELTRLADHARALSEGLQQPLA